MSVYDISALDKLAKVTSPQKAELGWQHYLQENTPIGSLFKNHKMFEPVNNGEGLTLIHVTTSYDEIERNGFMYASGGCLGASIYAAPLRLDGTLHNLSKFLINYEVPKSLEAQKRSGDKIDLLAIHLEKENFKDFLPKKYGFDYFCLGEVQAKVLRQIIELGIFDKKDLKQLKKRIEKQITGTSKLLETCQSDIYNFEDLKFLKLFTESIEQMPLLGYIYFESLVEYISLFQNDKEARRYYEQGELYNCHFKKLVFETAPSLLRGFKLVNFKPKISKICSYLRNESLRGKIITDFSQDHFLRFLKYRISQYINFKLIGGKKLNSKLDFGTLLEDNPSLIGHLFQKAIREFPNLSQQHFLFEEIKAEVVWNRWNKQKVICPFNSIVPKGEIGVNPRYPNLIYKIYKAKLVNKQSKVEFIKETNIRLAPKLINPGIALMSAPNKLPFNI